MDYFAANIDKVTHAKSSKVIVETKTPENLIKKILRLVSVDADGFSESKDWPYLWSGQHRKNHK